MLWFEFFPLFCIVNVSMSFGKLLRKSVQRRRKCSERRFDIKHVILCYTEGDCNKIDILFQFMSVMSTVSYESIQSVTYDICQLMLIKAGFYL